jgi:hypothetical protein
MRRGERADVARSKDGSTASGLLGIIQLGLGIRAFWNESTGSTTTQSWSLDSTDLFSLPALMWPLLRNITQNYVDNQLLFPDVLVVKLWIRFYEHEPSTCLIALFGSQRNGETGFAEKLKIRWIRIGRKIIAIHFYVTMILKVWILKHSVLSVPFFIDLFVVEIQSKSLQKFGERLTSKINQEQKMLLCKLPKVVREMNVQV